MRWPGCNRFRDCIIQSWQGTGFTQRIAHCL